jgi:hypothetical protein
MTRLDLPYVAFRRMKNHEFISPRAHIESVLSARFVKSPGRDCRAQIAANVKSDSSFDVF